MRAAVKARGGGCVVTRPSHKQLVTAALAQIRDRGALGASELADCGKSKGSWWGWSQGKEILEWLFWIGDVTTARRRNFERLYDLTERVLPERVRAATPCLARAGTARADGDRRRALGRRDAAGSARLLPFADRRCSDARRRSWWRRARCSRSASKAGSSRRICTRDAACPRAASDVGALLSPFDSLIWERQRTERLFDFHFRLEIYTPSTSDCTATTCCRSCWAIGWSAASI